MSKKTSLNKFSPRAFSLIELSIVILIVGILIAGITQASSLIEKMAINSARSLTTSSPVSGIKDLVAWYETTSEKSFLPSVDPDNSSQNAVSTWNDINPSSINKCNLSTTQSSTGRTAANAPILQRKAIGNLPAVLFDGATTYLSCDNLASHFSGGDKPMTIFIVAKPIGVATAHQNSLASFSHSTNGGVNIFFHISSNSTAYYFRSQAAPYGSSGMPVSDNITFIASWTNYSADSLSTTVSSYLNGNLRFANQQNITNPPPIPLNQFSIGAMTRSSLTGQYFYNGHLAELIIFNRVLTSEELTSIHGYLKQKWSVK